MTVKELIQELQKYDGESLVEIHSWTDFEFMEEARKELEEKDPGQDGLIVVSEAVFFDSWEEDTDEGPQKFVSICNKEEI